MTVTVEWYLLSSKADLFLGIMNHKMNGDYCQKGVVPMAIVSFEFGKKFGFKSMKGLLYK